MWGRCLCATTVASCSLLDVGSLQSDKDSGRADSSPEATTADVATDSPLSGDAGLDADFSCNAKDLLGFWRASEGSGQTYIDCTTNHFDAKILGGPPWTLVGRDGKRPSVKYNGSNDYAELDYAGLLVSGAFSVSLWTYETDTDGTLMGRASQQVNWIGWLLEYETAGTNFRVGPVQISGPPLAKSTWVHVAAVYAPSSSMDLYIGGKRVASQTSGVPASVPAASTREHMAFIPTPGLDGSTPYHHLAGGLQDIRFYGAAISAETIAALALE